MSSYNFSIRLSLSYNSFLKVTPDYNVDFVYLVERVFGLIFSYFILTVLYFVALYIHSFPSSLVAYGIKCLIASS
jgi:hypothetical protein